jgi:ketosteroid isomerase-like protein
VPNYTEREQEALDTYQRYLATRRRIDAGEKDWKALAAFFTDDATFVDPAWGRVEGIEAITEFLHDSMVGLDDWDFPEIWTTVDGDRVVSMFLNRIPGADGSWHEVPGVSVMEYAGDGRFGAESDLINMVHIHEALGDSGWSPTGPMNVPPQRPTR